MPLRGPHLYRLKGHEAAPCLDAAEWAAWFETSWPARQVAEDYVRDEEGRIVRVSTVFIGLDHDILGPAPAIFETMIFDTKGHEQGTWRYSTWEEAEAGHAKIAANVRKLAEAGWPLEWEEDEEEEETVDG